MTARSPRRHFITRPGDPERWVKAPEPRPANGAEPAGFTARLTIDVTPDLRGRIKIAAFQRGVTVADMLRELLAREFPSTEGDTPMKDASHLRLVPHLPSDGLTHVELTWIEKKVEHWIRFGREAHEQILDRRRRIVGFAPNSVFAFVRWAANDHGTVISRIDIVRATMPGERYQTLPFVRPGGDILLKMESWPKVERVLQIVDAIEAAGIDSTEVSPHHWRHVHNRLIAGEEPRRYTVEQHRAILLRRGVEP